MLDLFSGIGGFSLAADWAGFETVGFCEINKFCSQILSKHWPEIPNHGDIKNIHSHKYVDVVTGGFPCQPFSIAGKRKGKNDERHLWPEMLRIISESKPAWVVAENVPGIISIALDEITKDLENEGYASESFLIPASAVNAPHKRERLYIIAHRASERCNLWPSDWNERHFQNYLDGYIKTIYPDWEKLQSHNWKTFKAQDWFDFSARASRANNGISNRLDRIKSLGNSIVPQVAYGFLSIIKYLEMNEHSTK